MNPEDRGQDWITFRLKADAPRRVALGGGRFSGIWERANEPFRATAGEWKIFLEPTGWFETEESEVRRQKSEAGKGGAVADSVIPANAGIPTDPRLRGDDEGQTPAAGRLFTFRLPWKKEN